MLAELTKQKDQGNQIFKKGRFRQAADKFNEIIIKIETGEDKSYLSNQTELGKLYVICLINAAFACINLDSELNYEQAINYCNKALAVDPNNIKALYRRGLALKERGHKLEIQKGSNYDGILDLYEKSKSDFDRLSILDKNNELATKKLSEVIKDIYRVTLLRGEEVDLTSKKNQSEELKQKKSPYEIPNAKGVQKKSLDMSKIMKQYHVEEVTEKVQDKIRAQYLEGPLPTSKSDFEKAVRTIGKSDETLLAFVERLDTEYLKKIQPSFDTLETLTSVILRKGSGEKSAAALTAIKEQKSFNLLWKSYSSKQKEQFHLKQKELGVTEKESP